MDYDMHLHSTASDGTLSPTEIVERAKMKNLTGLSLTDHDTVDGIREAKKKAVELELDFIPGIELSANLYGKDVHILGYFVDVDDKDFLDFLEEIKKSRDKRNSRILQKLRKYKIDISEEELEREAGGEIRSRLHIANLIIKRGYAYSKAEAFANYLGKGGLAYEERAEFTPKLAVEALKRNGALAFLAHPKLYSGSLREVEYLVTELKAVGLDGIESEYATFDKQDKKMYREFAKKHNLLISGGSDYHGENRKDIDIGCEGITTSIVELWREKK
ncbi:MAG: PHP domain-containing protein [Fusobacteriaceae bacterium]